MDTDPEELDDATNAVCAKSGSKTLWRRMEWLSSMQSLGCEVEIPTPISIQITIVYLTLSELIYYSLMHIRNLSLPMLFTVPGVLGVTLHFFCHFTGWRALARMSQVIGAWLAN